MKINTLVKYDQNMNEFYSESFDYNGIIAFCGGGKDMPEAPEAPEPVVKQQTKSVTESSSAARDAQAQKAAQAKGLKATLLSNQDNTTTDTTQATTTSNKKTLLG